MSFYLAKYDFYKKDDQKMKLDVAALLLKTLPTQPETALTVKQLAEKWPIDGTPSSKLRSMFRYINELSAGNWELDVPPLIHVIEDQPKRYYLNLTAVSSWFMRDEIALNLVLSRTIISKPLSPIYQLGISDVDSITAHVLSQKTNIVTQRIRDTIRVLPDGLGRCWVKIEPSVLQTTIDAICSKRKIEFSYMSARGNHSTRLVNPLALIVKDGTVYLLATSGFESHPQHYALQRIEKVQISNQILMNNDFNLDQYIEDTHQLSHPVSQYLEKIHLVLHVNPSALFHFRERPLAENQTISHEPVSPGGWYRVDVELPETILLIPWLLGMGGNIKVVEPPKIREEISNRIKAMRAHYD